MATASVTPSRDAAKSLDALGTEIQTQSHRILSLVDAIDDVLDQAPTDDPEERVSREGRAIDYIYLIRQAAAKARDAGEEVEMFALHARRAGSAQ
jgi:hypothetical protein